MSYRISRRISMMSRKPRVVMSAVDAPLRSMSALMTSVVPWITDSSACASPGISSASSASPCPMPRDGSSGVVRTFAVR